MSCDDHICESISPFEGTSYEYCFPYFSPGGNKFNVYGRNQDEDCIFAAIFCTENEQALCIYDSIDDQDSTSRITIGYFLLKLPDDMIAVVYGHGTNSGNSQQQSSKMRR